MTLILEIEYLAGVAFAARGPESGAPDWPPQPDRIFLRLLLHGVHRENRTMRARL
jgi:CRISPR-associated protein Csb2